MLYEMNRGEILQCLHELDEKLDSPLNILVCGSSCAILNYGLERSTIDKAIRPDLVKTSDGFVYRTAQEVEE